jgi:GT2 family glycosyltransferase
MLNMTKIAILIPVFNNLDYTKNCLSNLLEILDKKESDNQYFIIVIDDGSKDGTSEWIRINCPQVVILNGDGNLWWSGGINLGAQHAINVLKCEYVLLWNNDIHIEKDYFEKVNSIILRYNTRTIVGSKIYADGNKLLVWSMGGYFSPRRGTFGMYEYMKPNRTELEIPKEVDWLTGMGTLVPSLVIKEIGYWDALNFPQYHGDTEFTYRAKIKGFKIIVDPRLAIWNDVANTGLSHKGQFRHLLNLFTDKRSLYNVRVNLRFLKLYSKGIRAYTPIIIGYFTLLASFTKRKIMILLGLKK